MRISDWSSDVCSSDLLVVGSESGMVLLPEASVRKKGRLGPGQMIAVDLDNGTLYEDLAIKDKIADAQDYPSRVKGFRRSEEHTSELQSLMRISYAVFCLKKKKKHDQQARYTT